MRRPRVHRTLSKVFIFCRMSLCCGRRTRGQACTRPLPVSLRENLVKLRIAAKARSVHGFSHSLLFRPPELLPEAREAQRVTVVAERHTDLPSECPAQICIARAASPRDLAQIHLRAAVAHQFQRAAYGAMQ